MGGMRDRNRKGTGKKEDDNGMLENFREMTSIFIVLTVVMVLQLYTRVITCEIVFLKYVQFIIV